MPGLSDPSCGLPSMPDPATQALPRKTRLYVLTVASLGALVVGLSVSDVIQPAVSVAHSVAVACCPHCRQRPSARYAAEHQHQHFNFGDVRSSRHVALWCGGRDRPGSPRRAVHLASTVLVPGDFVGNKLSSTWQRRLCHSGLQRSQQESLRCSRRRSASRLAVPRQLCRLHRALLPAEQLAAGSRDRAATARQAFQIWSKYFKDFWSTMAPADHSAQCSIYNTRTVDPVFVAIILPLLFVLFLTYQWSNNARRGGTPKERRTEPSFPVDGRSPCARDRCQRPSHSRAYPPRSAVHDGAGRRLSAWRIESKSTH